MKFAIQFLIIFAIISAGISPACAFVNGGKTMAELCGIDADVQSVDIPEEYLPYLPKEKQTKEHENAVKDCNFCMFSAASKTFQTQSFPALVSLESGYIQNGAGSYIPQSLDYRAFSPRGPPAFS